MRDGMILKGYHRVVTYSYLTTEDYVCCNGLICPLSFIYKKLGSDFYSGKNEHENREH